VTFSKRDPELMTLIFRPNGAGAKPWGMLYVVDAVNRPLLVAAIRDALDTASARHAGNAPSSAESPECAEPSLHRGNTEHVADNSRQLDGIVHSSDGDVDVSASHSTPKDSMHSMGANAARDDQSTLAQDKNSLKDITDSHKAGETVVGRGGATDEKPRNEVEKQQTDEKSMTDEKKAKREAEEQAKREAEEQAKQELETLALGDDLVQAASAPVGKTSIDDSKDELDWLADVDISSASAPAGSGDVGASSSAAALDDDDDVPDWLKE